MVEHPLRESITRWIERGEDFAVVCFRNQDTERCIAGGSERRGLLAVWRVKRWARKHGLDGLGVRPWAG